MSVVVVCPDFFDKLPRGSKGVTALWPRGVLNEMNRNSQKTLFLDQFQTRLRGGKPGLRGPENDRFSLFLRQFQIRCGLHERFAPLLCRVLSSNSILVILMVFPTLLLSLKIRKFENFASFKRLLEHGRIVSSSQSRDTCHSYAHR